MLFHWLYFVDVFFPNASIIQHKHATCTYKSSYLQFLYRNKPMCNLSRILYTVPNCRQVNRLYCTTKTQSCGDRATVVTKVTVCGTTADTPHSTMKGHMTRISSTAVHRHGDPGSMRERKLSLSLPLSPRHTSELGNTDWFPHLQYASMFGNKGVCAHVHTM